MMIVLVIAFTVFLINFTSSIGFNSFIPYDYENSFFFSGGISIIFIDFTTVVLILVLILAFVVVIIVTTTLIITKKRDIAIMKALGSIPQRLYGFYLTEVFVVFLIGFVIGAIIGFVSYVIFFFIASFLGVLATFQVDIVYLPILFISCLVGIYLFPGVVLRKLGMQNTIKLFSRDIPSNYDASKKLTTIPRWLSSIGYNVKISVLNTLRRRGEFKRYLIVFTIISLIIFTLGLGSILLKTSSQEWIRKSQGTNIVAIGHKDVLQNYTLMYDMFSNPDILVTQNDIDFLSPDYLFNLSKVEGLTNFTAIEKIDQRLINFFNVTELDGYHFFEDGGSLAVGQDRKAIIPIIGFNASEIIQDFEIVGEYIAIEDNVNMMIGDGLGYNLFDYPLDQSLRIEELGTGHPFHISAVVIDSFYSGSAGYVDLSVMQGDLNFSSNEINLLLLKVKSSEYADVIGDIELIIQTNLGENFSFVNLNQTFENNYSYLEILTFYPLLIIILMAIISIFALYNYQKGNISEKAKDFLIMRAVGAKYKSIKKILFLEAFYMIVPALVLSMGIGMVINSLFLFDRVYLPNLSLPFMIIGILFVAFLMFNYLSLFPILKKIKKFTIKDFDIW